MSDESPYQNREFLNQLLAKAVAARASDVHLKVGSPPAARVQGDLVFFRAEPLRPADLSAIAGHVIRGAEQRKRVDELFELDGAYQADGLCRFRYNLFRQRGELGIALRAIPAQVPTFEGLGIPAAGATLCEKDRGLVLVVGAAGNGKSSTLAAMVGHLNRTQALHIVTIEDPIEYLHKDEKSSVSQREVGIDTSSFDAALRAAMRQDPDVILVGEVRDEETMDTALKAAETGHLVLATLHTPDVARTFGRMFSLAPRSHGSADEWRERVASTLQGVVAQRLLPRRDGQGQTLAAEILVCSGSVREAIKRPEHSPSLKELMEKGVHPYGMQTFEMHLRQLVSQGIVDKDVAQRAASF